ncbi:MAG: hypothetical protein ABIT05_11180 [Chitinophagaceae bacterium]
MESTSIAKSALLMFFIVLVSLAAWEIHLRNSGVTRTYDDGGPLWSDKRSRVYQPAEKATVFIGSSRIKFDLDIPTWETMTGTRAVQLACVGSNPIPLLQDLADDPGFKGRLVVDVTEILFFSTAPPNLERPLSSIRYYKDRTPAQRASFALDHLLESQLAFLDKDNFSLNAYLSKLPIKDRPGVFQEPIFPWQFGRVNFDRQETMTTEFLSDTNLHRRVTNIWEFFRSISKEPPASGAKLDSLLNIVKISADKIKARGGSVFFVRTPSSGPFWQGEQMGYPRDKYWEKILQVTGCEGLHFMDYPALNHFVCPEWSHLSPADALVFTKEFIRILREEKGWTFPVATTEPQ